MQLVSSRIWTRVAVSIYYDDNHYTLFDFPVWVTRSFDFSENIAKITMAPLNNFGKHLTCYTIDVSLSNPSCFISVESFPGYIHTLLGIISPIKVRIFSIYLRNLENVFLTFRKLVYCLLHNEWGSIYWIPVNFRFSLIWWNFPSFFPE